MRMRILVCMNCLVTSQDPPDNGPIRAIPVGVERGTQYDRYQESVDLCEDCAEALVLGNFVRLAERNRTERTLKVGRE
jgi:hypothetical protein